MNVRDIEIPLVSERGWRYRFFEILPGAITWTILIAPIIISIFHPLLMIILVLAYLLLWFVKSIGLDIRALQGYKRMQLHKQLPWQQMITDIETGHAEPSKLLPKWHFSNIARLQTNPAPVKPSELIHVAMIATYNESREVLEPTIKSVLDSYYDPQKIILVLAYEERGGADVEAQAKELAKKYESKFMHFMAVKHPKDIPNEIIGKGGNITYAGRELEKYLRTQYIDPIKVAVTTLDADNRPHPNYFAALTYTYCVCPDPVHISFQPIPMYTNNIWDAPAPMRVIATGNSFWNVVLSLRPHMLRNFSSHAQSMETIIDTNFWSVRTIVEDGHQFWRTYFRYDGQHEVFPIYVPIYQDAVFAKGYLRTLKAQFVQLRRWAWGASDVAYLVEMGVFRKNKVPRRDLMFKFGRLLEGHVTWAVAPFIIAFAAFIPAFINPRSYAAIQLPVIASRINAIALVGIFASLFISIKTLPPRPARYKRHRNFFMIIQWVYLPLTTVAYTALSALYSQTRLMFGWYIGKFDLTEKAVKTDDNKTVS